MTASPLLPDVLRQKLPGIDSVEPCVAAGGFKWVYGATVRGRKEALKVVMMRESIDIDPEAAEAFRREQVGRVCREIEALGKCRSPEIVKLGGVYPCEFEVAGRHYVAYSEEFVEGSDLWKLIRAGSHRPNLAELVELFAALLRCIEELWSHGYVHRDIKPQNVMRTGNPARPFVLLDLGIAYAVYEVSLTYQADERMPPATYRYLAPEMMEADFRDRLDFRADLYTTGMTVYEYAAGRHPLVDDSDDLMRTVSRALRQPPTPLERHRPDLPVTFCKLVNGMLKKKPALRPANLKLIHQQLGALE